MQENSLVFEQVLDSARRSLVTLRSALSGLSGCIDKDFFDSVQLLATADGNVILTGVGKSACVARKISHTLASLGMPSFFLHATELGHGDLGNVHSRDIVIAMSHSGETPELITVLKSVKTRCRKLIAIVGKSDSSLAKTADHQLCIGPVQEIGHLGLAPTTSTTMAMVLGDLLATCAAEARCFDKEDFARSHPSGRLGQLLTLQVKDVMMVSDACAFTDVDDSVFESLFAMTDKSQSVSVVCRLHHAVGVQPFTLVKQARMLDHTLRNIKNAQYMTPFKLQLQHNTLLYHALSQIGSSTERYYPVYDDSKFVGLFDVRAWKT